MVTLLDDDGDLSRGVARRRDERDITGLGQPQARAEGPERSCRQVDRRRVERGRPALVRVPADPAEEPAGVLQLGARDEDLAVREVMQAARVVGVQMRHHDPAHVARPDAEPLELRADLLLGCDVLADREAQKRVPAREVARLRDAGRLAGVDHDHAFGMLDREGVDRQRLGPLPIEERVQQTEPAAAGAFAPAHREGDGAGLDRVDVHRGLSLGFGVGAVGAKPRRISSATPPASRSSMGPPVTSSR